MLRNRLVIIFCAILLIVALPSQIPVSAASNRTGSSFDIPIRSVQDIDTETPTPTETETPMDTETATPTETETPTETVPPTDTNTPTETVVDTATPTLTPTTTATSTPTLNPSNRYVAPGGADTSNCNNLAAPCATINYAIGQSGDGNTIYVATGTYTGTGAEVILLQDKNVLFSGGWDVSFTTQAGLSIIDGQTTRRGITMTNSAVTIAYFKIQNGYSDYLEGGGIYKNQGTLTLNNSIVTNNAAGSNGGGISNYGVLTINDSTISNNTSTCCGNGSADGGGGIHNGGTLTINNSTLNNNRVAGSYVGGAIFNGESSTIILNNSTIIGNIGDSDYTEPSSIDNEGNLTINNSTISGNMGGIYRASGSVVLKNSILLNNVISGIGEECYWPITSAGYNLTNQSCIPAASPGDLISTSQNPLNPKLGPLQNNGGPTFTRALLSGSPAINAGNPAASGSGGNACVATDQRGIDRSQNSRCDMGAYETDTLMVGSIQRLNPNNTSASQVKFKVTFSKNVIGVNTTAPFTDFKLTITGATGASIYSVTGSNSIYTVTVNTGHGNGTIRLDIIDDDSIQDTSNNAKLGGTGLGNGNYTQGQTYTISTLPIQISPVGFSGINPTYQWKPIPGGTQYQYQVIMGTKTIYTKTVGASVCKSSGCSDTPTNKLVLGAYQWRIRAMSGGVWKSFSAYKTFSVALPKAGFWVGETGLYVTPDSANIINYTIFVTVYSCNIHEQPLVFKTPVPIINNKYLHQGAVYFSGTFNTKTSDTTALFALHNYYWPGCGSISGGPYSTIHTWSTSSQPSLLNSAEFTLTNPDPSAFPPTIFYIP